MSSYPVAFDDGSSGMVSEDKLTAALKDGGKVVQPMLFDDGSRGLVALDKMGDALKDGGTPIGMQPPKPRVNMREMGPPPGIVSGVYSTAKNVLGLPGSI